MYCRAVFRGELPTVFCHCITKLEYEFQTNFFLKNFHNLISSLSLSLLLNCFWNLANLAKVQSCSYKKACRGVYRYTLYVFLSGTSTYLQRRTELLQLLQVARESTSFCLYWSVTDGPPWTMFCSDLRNKNLPSSMISTWSGDSDKFPSPSPFFPLSRPVQTNATLLANNTQHCWAQHIASVSMEPRQCWHLLRMVATGQTFRLIQTDVTLLANNTQ